ncbi:MAG: hypothetical protein ACFFCZ_23585, partial [Promethearchaeota archaeon]
YTLAGGTASYGAGGSDYWLVKTEGMAFPTSIFGYLVIIVIGSSVGLLASRPVYRRYNKWRQKRTTSKALREDVNHL